MIIQKIAKGITVVGKSRGLSYGARVYDRRGLGMRDYDGREWLL